MAVPLHPINLVLQSREPLYRLRIILREWWLVIVLGLDACLHWKLGRWLYAPLTVRSSVVAVLILGFLVTAFILISRRRRRVDAERNVEVILERLKTDPRPLLRDLLRPGQELAQLLSSARSEDQVVEFLSDATCSGEAVCISAYPKRLPASIEPIAVSFEPIPLDRASAESLRPNEHGGSSARRFLGMDFAAITNASRRLLRMLHRSGIGRGFGLILLLGLVGQLLRAGPFHPGVLFRVAILSIWLFLFIRTDRIAGLYLIPGGLIHARRRLVYYRRSHSALFWCADSRILHVRASDRESLELLLTVPEAMMTLRARLSPIPPPSDEMVESFLTGS